MGKQELLHVLPTRVSLRYQAVLVLCLLLFLEKVVKMGFFAFEEEEEED